MTFLVTIDTDNEAFGEDPSLDLAWILRKLADTVVRELTASAPFSCPLRNVNGDQVGLAEWTPPDTKSGADTEGAAPA